MTSIETNHKGQVIITVGDLPIKQYKNAASFEEKKMIAAQASNTGEESVASMKAYYESLSDDEKKKFLKKKFEQTRFNELIEELGLKVGFTR